MVPKVFEPFEVLLYCDGYIHVVVCSFVGKYRKRHCCHPSFDIHIGCFGYSFFCFFFVVGKVLPRGEGGGYLVHGQFLFSFSLIVHPSIS